ncbi:MAG: hypothetical protein GY830_01625 [Bacteroidetes bacterium]|nr:hypothetical protein [Bacteroidota bacterium]
MHLRHIKKKLSSIKAIAKGKYTNQKKDFKYYLYIINLISIFSIFIY